MKELRRLNFKNIEIRSEENEGKRTLIGMIPYNSKSVDMFGYREIIAPTAFNKTIADGSEVRALFNHDDGKVLASTRNGTLTLESGSDGLLCRAEINNTSYANDVYEIISRGDVTTLSFGFVPVKHTDDHATKIRTLNEVKLLEVSFGVSQPAYPETNSIAHMRGFQQRNINIEGLNEVLEKSAHLDDNDIEIVKNTIQTLQSILPKEESPAEEAAAEQPTGVTDTETERANDTELEAQKALELEMQIEMELN